MVRGGSKTEHKFKELYAIWFAFYCLSYYFRFLDFVYFPNVALAGLDPSRGADNDPPLDI